LRSIHAHLGPDYARVRLGIGHPGHKDRVSGYVLGNFAKSDEDWLDDLLRGISEGAAELAAGDTARFLNAVALRTAPPRVSTGTSRPAAAEADTSKGKAAPDREVEQSSEPDARSALQRLADRFR
jgi:PTH1 family peptidyl-tRNA hydrolase